jgi:hypothetical protein
VAMLLDRICALRSMLGVPCRTVVRR